MRRLRASGASVVIRLLVFLVLPQAAQAQGVSGSEVSGFVRASDGHPSADVTVSLVNRNTGAERRTRTSSSGSYRFESVDVGRYRIEAKAIGVKASFADSVELHLGDRVRLDIVLGPAVLEDAVIHAAQLRDPGAGGPAETIAGRAARNIPLLNRDFTGLLVLSSQALGSQGLWITGQHSRYNGIQIDGAAANDFFGVNVTPGSSSGGRLISNEAIEEVRILTAPFDVRMGGFAGGLINAVTRSGSNRSRYSTFAYLTRSDLIGSDTAGVRISEFNQLQYGVSAGGPIVRDRLHYFLAAEFQQRAATFIGPPASDPATGVSEATALRVRNAIRNRYGFDPGGTSFPDLNTPTANVFLKLSWHPRTNVSVDLMPSYATAERDSSSRSIKGGDGWQLSESGAQTFSRTAGAVLKANFVHGAVANETIAGFETNQFGIRSSVRAPLFLVQADAAEVYVAAGSMRGAQGTKTRVSVAQLAHNLSWTKGSHTMVAGTQNYLVGVHDDFLGSAWGVWTFASADSLEQGRPSRYEIGLPVRRGEPTASYQTLLASLYGQDQWDITPSLRLTLGLRGDAPFFESPGRNTRLLANDSLGNIDTRDVPSANWTFSPRLGFAWTIDRKRTTMVRGGFGLFTARPPFAWVTGVYSLTGETQTFLTCTPAQGIPAVSVDVDDMPDSCAGNGGASAPIPSVNYFEKGFRMPQSVKAVIGLDRNIAHRWLASVDLIAARTRNQLFVSDDNLVLKSTNSEGRAMYGTVPSSGNAQPARLSKQYGAVYRFGNYSDDRSMSVTTSIRRDWSDEKLIHVGYTWTRTVDVLGLAGFNGQVFLRNNPLDGQLESRVLRRSPRDIPHNFVATAVFPVMSGFVGGLFLRARSGTPWAFTVNGDANADGARSNDLAYVPRDSSDITLIDPAAWRALDDLIESLPCAKAQRGRIMHRNSCRNHGVATLDARLSKAFTLKRTQRAEISADLINVPNMLNHRWGVVRETSSREDVPLFSVVGWDNAHNRPRYSIPVPINSVPILPSIDKAVIDMSRWRVQLGARYEF